MPIDIGTSINSIGNYVFGNDSLKYLFSNSLIVSIIISIIVLLLTLQIVNIKHKSLYKICKLLIYITLSTFFIIFIHNGVNKNNENIKNRTGVTSSFMDGYDQENNAIYTDVNNIPITPDIGGGYYNNPSLHGGLPTQLPTQLPIQLPTQLSTNEINSQQTNVFGGQINDELE